MQSVAASRLSLKLRLAAKTRKLIIHVLQFTSKTRTNRICQTIFGALEDIAGSKVRRLIHICESRNSLNSETLLLRFAKNIPIQMASKGSVL